MADFIDPLGRKVILPKNPQRIISLCPSITETLFDLGLEPRIVGRTLFCIHPAEKVSSVARIGGTKNVDLERVTALNPDLIIAEKEENLKEAVLVLEQKCPTYVMNVTDMNSATEMILMLGELCGIQQVADKMIKNILQKWEKFVPLKKPKRTAYFIWKSPYMIAGKETFIDAIMASCNLENVYTKPDSRYPEITLEGLKELSPEVILLSSEPYPFAEKHILEFQNHFPETEVLIVDGEMFSWYGSRMLMAPTYLETLLGNLS